MTGDKNTYTCAGCGHVMVTVDLEEGVTPMILRCDECGGRAMSAFYSVPPDLTPTFGWKKPAGTEFEKFGDDVREAVRNHVQRGGLCLYRIGEGPDDLELVTQ